MTFANSGKNNKRKFYKHVLFPTAFIRKTPKGYEDLLAKICVSKPSKCTTSLINKTPLVGVVGHDWSLQIRVTLLINLKTPCDVCGDILWY